MKKQVILIIFSALSVTGCVSKKQYAEMESRHKETKDLLNTATVKLNVCNEERAALIAENDGLKSSVTLLKNTNGDLIRQIGSFTDLTKQGAENLERSLENIKEKDLTIRKLNEAVTRRDSVTIALVQSLKGAIGDLYDEDININVEKGVVYVNISDKLLFNSGSYEVTPLAYEVLGKVAQVVNNKPDFEFLVEGHTDDVPISNNCIKDNWDLSVLRATAVVRTLQNDLDVAPERMTAGGRGKYLPLTENSTPEGRAKNRRTRIVVLPKLDQFYEMIEEGL